MIPALRFRRREIQWGRARELLSFGGWSLLGYIALKLREATVMTLLDWYASLADVTIFAFAYLGRRQVDGWMDAMGSSLYSVVTGMHALGAKDRIRSIYLRGGRITLWITLFVAMPAALYARSIMRLYAGEACEEAAVAMVLTLASLPITGGAWMLWQVSNATARVRIPNLYSFSIQLIVIPLVFGVVHWLRSDPNVPGLVPAGIGLVLFGVGVFPESLVLWPLGLKLADASFRVWAQETLLPGLAPACLASVVWSALGVLVAPSSWVALGLCTLAGMVCYALVLLAFCLEPRDREDLATVRAKLKNLVSRRCAGPGPVPSPATAGPATGLPQ
jgi:O-antigen/teichoic acid export membrane protein